MARHLIFNRLLNSFMNYLVAKSMVSKSKTCKASGSDRDVANDQVLWDFILCCGVSSFWCCGGT